MINEINVLILSAGRRVELIDCFKGAKEKLKLIGNVVVGDCSALAPAVYFGDTHYILPRVNQSNYVDTIIDICNKENIALIVPTIDTELLILAENKERIEQTTNAKVMISDWFLIKLCRNKIDFQKHLENNGFAVPKLIVEDKDVNQFPVFIKPLDGSSSINAFKVNSWEELNFFREYIDKPIIQEYIEGTEYTVDVFCDFSSKPITIVPRERIATRSGEISKGKIEKNEKIIENIKKLVNVLKPIGHTTIQCIKNDDGIFYLEMNPRFGGGAPMSIAAGADSCENLYLLLTGNELIYNEAYRDNLFFLRFDRSIELSGESVAND